MESALGLIEIRGFADAVLISDVMVKTADVKTIEIERAQGSGWMTVKISGNVAAVNASINAGKRTGELYGSYISSKVIPRPAHPIRKLFCGEAFADFADAAPQASPPLEARTETEKRPKPAEAEAAVAEKGPEPAEVKAAAAEKGSEPAEVKAVAAEKEPKPAEVKTEDRAIERNETPEPPPTAVETERPAPVPKSAAPADAPKTNAQPEKTTSVEEPKKEKQTRQKKSESARASADAGKGAAKNATPGKVTN